jgi:hypothetical protein
MARCPAHDDHTPSLSIRDGDGGKVLVRCHAGCNQQAVITAVRARGLWPESGRRPLSRTASRDHNEYQPDQDDAKRRDAALAIWQSAMPAQTAELFHGPDGTGFADLGINGHRETWPIRSKGFRRWLVRQFFEELPPDPCDLSRWPPARQQRWSPLCARPL